MTNKAPEAASRKHEEFTRLFKGCANWLFGYLFSLLRNSADAEDAFQEVGRICWEKFDQYDRSMEFRAWACRIAYFKALKIFEHRKKQGDFCSEHFFETVASKAFEVADQLTERSTALKVCMKQLPEKDRNLLRQRYVFDVSAQELAEGLGRSVHAVYRSLRRIHQMLERCIKRSLSE